jgi:hypothetical protein
MSTATVKTHLTRIYAKLGVRSRTQLAALVRPHTDPAVPEGAALADESVA